MENCVVDSSSADSRQAVVQRYVDILSDAGLKAVFGDQRNKDVLIDLLNVILPPHRKVAEIAYETTEIPGFTLFNKSVRFDLRCRGEDGTFRSIRRRIASSPSIPSVKKPRWRCLMRLFFVSSWN